MGVDKDNRQDSKQYDDHFYEGDTLPLFGAGDAFSTARHLARSEGFQLQLGGSPALVDGERRRADGRLGIGPSGPLLQRRGRPLEGPRRPHTKVFYDERHPYNVEEMSVALDSAYTYYSQWFRPYPWQELKLSEFANLARYAQGFPTNITFSEGIGFLTKDKPGSNVAFLVTAHEAAHQWWGNLLVPGQGPGGNVLSEGTAHFSTGLLIEQVKGLAARIEFFDTIEHSYNDGRSADAERPLVKIDGSKDGDSTVMYDKGGWVFWMLLNHLGRDKMLEGLQQFIRQYHAGDDHPVLQDFVAAMRPYARDPQAYDAFVKQWFLEVVMPQYKFDNAQRDRLNDQQWQVTVRVTNVGTGRMAVEIAAATGDRFDDESQLRPEYRDQRTIVTLGQGEHADVTLTCDFEPQRLVVDPDRLVLQLKRKLSQHDF